MDCDHARSQLPLRLDGALAPEAAAALDDHLARCPSCRRACQDLQTLSAALRGHADRFTAPTALRSRVLADLAAAAPRRRPAGIGRWSDFGLGAALAASVMLAVNLTLAPSRPPAGPMADQVISAHIRSLMEGHLIDIASADRHTVKPWFNGRLDLAPPVRDFEAQGFPLVGGRLDVLGQRPVAALVYRRRLHVINLFVGPGDGTAGLDETGPVRGYTVLHWNDGGLACWLVSDVERAELIAFARLLRSPPPAQ
jgi:anti-sigma factor (TIGR02949 family)